MRDTHPPSYTYMHMQEKWKKIRKVTPDSITELLGIRLPSPLGIYTRDFMYNKLCFPNDSLSLRPFKAKYFHNQPPDIYVSPIN